MNTDKPKLPTNAERNAAFALLSPAEKRVQIAYDVLAQLDAAKPMFKVLVSNGYVKMKTDWQDFLVEGTEKVDMQKVFEQKDVTCEVCAKGALFAAKALNYNNAVINQYDVDAGYHSIAIEDETIVRNLDGIFTRVQLDLIENAFEGSMLNNVVPHSHLPRYARAACMFDGMNLTPENRLRAIMKRIIELKGDFRAPTFAELTDEGRANARSMIRQY